MSGLGAGIIGGALGGGLAVTVLAPLTAANNFLGSYFFGSGMILGERQMYQDDWIKIKERLDKGESFLVILEEVMKPNTQAVMQMARETVIAVSEEWNRIVLDYIQSIPQSLWDAINRLNTGETDLLDEGNADIENGISGYINGQVRCIAGWHPNTQKTACLRNSGLDSGGSPPPGPTPPPPTPGGAADLDKLLADAINAGWIQIVGPKTKSQIIAIIKSHEATLKTTYASIKSWKGRVQNSVLAARISAAEQKIRVFNELIRMHKLALAWLAKQGTGGAKITPDPRDL